MSAHYQDQDFKIASERTNGPSSMSPSPIDFQMLLCEKENQTENTRFNLNLPQNDVNMNRLALNYPDASTSIEGKNSTMIKRPYPRPLTKKKSGKNLSVEENNAFSSKKSNSLEFQSDSPPATNIGREATDFHDDPRRWDDWVQGLMDDIENSNNSSVKNPAPQVLNEKRAREDLHSKTGKRRKTEFEDASTSVLQETTFNNDFCDFCQQAGNFVCCSGCPRSYHYSCADPPVTEEMVSKIDHWYCRSCRNLISKKKPVYRGLFKDLLHNIDNACPHVFSLTQDIKTFFSDTSWDALNGDYVDQEESVPVKFRGDDASKFCDAEGNPILCQKCRSSCYTGPMILCDFCPLGWHMDCLDPPMTAYPPSTKRWLCPAHVKNLKKKNRKIAETGSHVLLADPQHKNDGDIDVMLSAKDFDGEYIDRSKRVIYKVPEKAIRIALFDKVWGNKSGKTDQSSPSSFSHNSTPSKVSLPPGIDRKNFLDTLERPHKVQISNFSEGKIAIPNSLGDGYEAGYTDTSENCAETANLLLSFKDVQKENISTSESDSIVEQSSSVISMILKETDEQFLERVALGEEPGFESVRIQFNAWKRLMDLSAGTQSLHKNSEKTKKASRNVLNEIFDSNV